MPGGNEKVAMELGIDLSELEADTRAAERILDGFFKTIGQEGNPVLTKMMDNIRGMAQQIDLLTRATSKYNHEAGKGQQQDNDRLKQAQAIRKEHRDILAIRQAEQIMAHGGPGTDKVGAYGGRSRQYRGRAAEMLTAGVGAARGLLNDTGLKGQVAAVGGLGSAALSAAGKPGMAQLVGALFGLIGDAVDARYRTVEARYSAFQAGGSQASGMMSRKRMMRFAMTPAELSSQISGYSHAAGTTGTGLDEVLKAQQSHGLGSKATGLVGAAVQGGVLPQKPGQERVRALLGKAIGMALADGLQKGRFGESFSQLTRALTSSVRGIVDVHQVQQMSKFIGGMGPQYGGDSASSRQMEQTIGGLAGGSGMQGYMSLKAAGFGQKGGPDFFTAQRMISRGVGKKGGINVEKLVGAYADFFQNQPTNMAAYQIAKMANLNQDDVAMILERHRKKDAWKVQSGAGEIEKEALSPTLQTVMHHRRGRVEGELFKARAGKVVEDVTTSIKGIPGALTGNKKWWKKNLLSYQVYQGVFNRDKGATSGSGAFSPTAAAANPEQTADLIRKLPTSVGYEAAFTRLLENSFVPKSVKEAVQEKMGGGGGGTPTPKFSPYKTYNRGDFDKTGFSRVGGGFSGLGKGATPMSFLKGHLGGQHSGFGARRSFTFNAAKWLPKGKMRIHHGEDLVTRGQALYAPAKGTISRVGKDKAGDPYAYLRTGKGKALKLLHMRSLAEGLTKGSKIEEGQKLGMTHKANSWRYGKGGQHVHVGAYQDGEIKRASDMYDLSKLFTPGGQNVRVTVEVIDGKVSKVNVKGAVKSTAKHALHGAHGSHTPSKGQ